MRVDRRALLGVSLVAAVFQVIQLLVLPESSNTPAVTQADYASCDSTFRENMCEPVSNHSPEQYNLTPCLLDDSKVGRVALILEETVRYGLDGTLAILEWLTLRAPWSHSGYVRIGEDNCLYGIAMVHQLHCVDMIAHAVSDPDSPGAGPEHIHHCLGYLRQIFLCSADTTLEPYDFLSRNYSMHPVGMTRTCRDWTAIYEASDANFKTWRDLVASSS